MRRGFLLGGGVPSPRGFQPARVMCRGMGAPRRQRWLSPICSHAR